MGDHVSLGKVSTAIGIVAALVASVFFLEDRYFPRAEASDQKAALEQKIEAERVAAAEAATRQAINQEVGQLETMVKLYKLELDLLIDKNPTTLRDQKKISYLESSITAAESRLLELRGTNVGSR